MTKQTSFLQILLVGDAAGDAELVARALSARDLPGRFERAGGVAAARQALRRRRWDAILTDHALPDGDAFEVLNLIKEFGEGAPCVVVSGANCDETAADMLGAGAVYVVGKEELKQLPHVLQRAVLEAETVRGKREAEAQLARANEELQELAAALRTRNAELEAVLEAVPAVVWIAQDATATHITGSRAAHELLRVPWGSNLSTSAPHSEAPTGFKVLIGGREAAAEELPVQAAARGLVLRDFEETVVFDDGGVRHLFGHAVPLWDAAGKPRGAVAAFIDITEHKESQAELQSANEALEQRVAERTEAVRRSEERWRLLVENHPEPIMITVDAVIRYVNPAGVAVLGASSPAPLLGRSLYEFLASDRHAELRARGEDLKRGCLTEPIETRLLGVDGIPRMVESFSVPISYEGVAAAQTVFRDVTERRLIEQELRDARHRLGEVRERERLQLARDLHDGVLQQLLGMSYQVADLQRQGVDHPDYQGALQSHREELLRTVKQLRSLVRDLRPAGIAELRLKRAIEEHVATLQHVSNHRLEVQLSLEGSDEHLPVHVANCLFRVVQEALRNTLKHAGRARAWVELEVNRELARLSVGDDGRGFEVPSRLSALAKGSHFGLLDLQEHVAQVGGTMVVASAPGRGTNLTVHVRW
ncbi:MAG TPA: PAS domain S-box protein [Trueperaceae bacterium]